MSPTETNENRQDAVKDEPGEPLTATTKKAVVAEPGPKTEDAAKVFVETLQAAEKPDEKLESQLKSIVDAHGWNRPLYECIHHKLVKLLETDAKTGATMETAKEKATQNMMEFKERRAKRGEPFEVTSEAIAIGIEGLLIPWYFEFLASLPDAQWSADTIEYRRRKKISEEEGRKYLEEISGGRVQDPSASCGEGHDGVGLKTKEG